MALIRTSDGRYDPKWKLTKKFLLWSSPTGLYKNELSILALIKSDATKMSTSLSSVSESSLKFLQNNSPDMKSQLINNYANADSAILKFSGRFYDIHENGGSIGREITPVNIFEPLSKILESNNELNNISDELAARDKINVHTIMLCSYHINNITSLGNDIVKNVNETYKKKNAEFSEFVKIFWSNQIRNGMHSL